MPVDTLFKEATMHPMTTPVQVHPAVPSSGGRLVTPDGRPMPLRGCSLEADARAGLARVILRQTFFNDAPEPLQATYQFPLPADAAVGGYSFTMQGRRVVGEIERREEARERYEEAILEGRTAGLVEQDRTSLFTQEIGNIPPQTEVVCELEIDQPLRWLEDGHWEWRFPTTLAPRYLGEPGRVPDGERVAVDVTTADSGARATLSLRIRDDDVIGLPGSPTHALDAGPDGAVRFAAEDGAPLDRDVVVRWAVTKPDVGVTIDAARPGEGPLARHAYGMVTVIPPSPEAEYAALARDVILLLDTSGSMSGKPLECAKAVAQAVVASMGPADQLEMIEFSSRPRRWRPQPLACDEATRAEAHAWITSLQAGGGTEMRDGLIEALETLRPDAQRQVVLLTDGLVGFDGEVVRAVRAGTPAGCRVHAVGIGSASNRSLTHTVAAAGRGGEVLIDLDEDAAAAADRVVARLSRPLVVSVQVRGSAVLESDEMTRDLLAGAPAMIPVKLRPEGGAVVIEGQLAGGGAWKAEAVVAPVAAGAGSGSLVRMFGRACVERLELEAAMGRNLDRKIEATGLEYRIATRLTSWVAIAEEPGVDPREPIRRTRIAQQLPYGMSARGLGLRAGARLVRSRLASDVARRMAACDRMDVESPPLPRYRIARIVSRRWGRLVLEIELDEEIDWDPVGAVLAYVDDVDIDIDLKKTTRPGRYGPGQRLRLKLTGVPATWSPSLNGGLLVRCPKHYIRFRILP
jgi:Ca-activated chloride channel homolog